MAKHIGTVFTDEQELLKAILDLHNKGKDLQLDPMFNKGKFYKKIINEPDLKFDLNPHELTGALKADAKDLPLLNNSIASMILDPPFLFNKYDKSSKIIKRYTKYDSFSEMINEYGHLVQEAARILYTKGLLIFKCQDLTTGGKTYMTHIDVANILEYHDFYIKDMVLLNKTNKMYKGNTTQRHFRKTHTYFYIAIKR